MDGGFELVQARIQARLATLPSDPLWLRLASQKGLPAYLESARPTAVGPWLASLSSASDAHEVDRTIRRHLAEAIEEVARWVPEPWAAAVRWTRWLAYLPELRAIDDGLPATAAIAEIPSLPVPRPDPEHGIEARAMRAAPDWLRTTRTKRTDLVQVWLSGWRLLWPRCGEGCVAALESLVLLLRRHAEAFPGLPEQAAWVSRRALVQQVRYLFRRHTGEAVAVFAYLALVALALEKLRGDLTRRALFPLPEVKA